MKKVHNRKSEHHHRVQRIRISIVANCHLKQTILIFFFFGINFFKTGTKNLAYRKYNLRIPTFFHLIKKTN